MGDFLSSSGQPVQVSISAHSMPVISCHKHALEGLRAKEGRRAINNDHPQDHATSNTNCTSCARLVGNLNTITLDGLA